MNARRVIVSWDFGAAVASAVIVAGITPRFIPNATAQDLFRVGTSVLSLLFSIFFAALAVIVSSANEEFLVWLASGTKSGEKGDYEKIVSAYRFSLLALFVALVVALWLFGYTSIRMGNGVHDQHKWFLVAFTFAFFYALFVAIQASFYAVKFSQFRNEFVVIKAESQSQLNTKKSR